MKPRLAPRAAPPTKTTKPSKAVDPIVEFESAAAFERWLAKNHATSPAVMVRIGKKGHPPRLAITDALDVALCWGWIDSVRRSESDTTYLQRYGRRTKTSPWSKINVGKVEALIAAGRMQPPGQREIDAAKADGRWERAYDGARTITVPDDLRAALDAEPAAARLFERLDATNRYAILFRLHKMKTPEGRKRRIQGDIERLARGVVAYPDRLPGAKKATRKSAPPKETPARPAPKKKAREVR
jgi:uncharacterized protein YdeI (YjbR/CyaY-like superfamily)